MDKGHLESDKNQMEAAKGQTEATKNQTEVTKNRTEVAKNRTKTAENRTELSGNRTDVPAQDPSQDFTQGSISKKMIQFMLPILGALILQAMYGAVDLMVVGHFGTTAGISGVSTGSNVMNLVTFVITGLATGVTVLIGQYLGEKNPDKIGPLIGGAIALFTVMGVIFTVALTIFAEPLALLMQAPSQALNDTISYIRICGAGVIFIIAYNLISCIFRGMGDSKSPLLFVGIACVVNIFGDLFCVGVLHMNAAGAALATVAAQAVSVICSLIIIKKRKSVIALHKKDIRFGPYVTRFVRIGFPIALQELLTQISFIFILVCINGLGLIASSGYGVASKLVSFVMLIPSSLMQSMASFVSQNVGARKEDRAKKAMVTGMAFGCLIGVAVFLLIIFRGDIFCAIFSTDSQVITEGWNYLRGFALEAIVTSILFSYMGYFNGHGQTLWVMIQSICQSFIVRLPMTYIMAIQPNASLMYIGFAAPTATIFGIVLNTVFYIHMQKKMKTESQIVPD